MKQLSGVDLDNLLQDLARLPGAVADKAQTKPETAAKDTGKVFGSD